MANNNLTPNVAGQIAYKPRRTSDAVIGLLKEQNARDEAAAGRYINSVNESMNAQIKDTERDVQAAKMYGDDVKKLTQFSQTLVNYFAEEQAKRNQAEMEEGIASAYTEGVPIEEQTALEAAESQISSADAVTQDAAGQAYEATGNAEVSRRVKDMSGWRGYGYQVGKAQIAGANYQGFMGAALENDNTTQITLNGETFTPATAKTLPQIQAAVAKLRGQYIRKMGLTGIPAAVLNKYAFPKMQFSDYGMIAKRQADAGSEAGFTDRQLATSQFAADKDLAAFVSRMKNSIDVDGKGVLGSAKAWERVEAQISTMVENGDISIEDVERMKGQPVPESWGLGKNKTFGELFGTRLDSAATKVTRRVRAEARVEREERERAASDAEAELLTKIESGEYNDADIDALQSEFIQTYKRSSRVLDDAKKRFSVDAETKKGQLAMIKELAASGALRPHHLTGIHPDIVLQFKGIAEGYESAAGPNNKGVSDDLKSLEDEVRKHLQLELGDPKGVEGGLIYQELASYYNSKFAQYAALNDPQARQKALVETLTYFNDNKGSVDGATPVPGRYSEGNIFKYYKDKTDLGKLSDITSALETSGSAALKKKGLIIDEAGMALIDKTYGTGQWKIPPIVQYVSDQTGIDPYKIINEQRAAMGLDPLESAAGEIKSQMTPEGQALLDNFKSSNRAIRSMSSSGIGWNPDTHPYGQIIDQVATNQGLEPTHIAALMEIESTNDPNAISYNGTSFGAMQINRSAHPDFFAGGDWRDPHYNIAYGANYFRTLLEKYGDPKAAAMAYNAGPGNYDTWAAGGTIPAAIEREMISHGKKFVKALSRYDTAQLNEPMARRGQFEVVQIVSTDPRYEGDDDPRTIRDVPGHGGDAMHQHYEFATKEQAKLAKALYESKGFRVTSYMRPHDHGSAHQHGYAIDVAPPLDLPRNDQAEMEWIDKANAVIGL